MLSADAKSEIKPVVLGAGPAGLTAAYALSNNGIPALVLEKSGMVGYRFDIGGHRFFTKIEEVNRIWREVLGDEFLRVPRLSRIYYNDSFFDYPLRIGNVLKGLGIL